jgi:hypothetical protein
MNDVTPNADDGTVRLETPDGYRKMDPEAAIRWAFDVQEALDVGRGLTGEEPTIKMCDDDGRVTLPQSPAREAREVAVAVAEAAHAVATYREVGR